MIPELKPKKIPVVEKISFAIALGAMFLFSKDKIGINCTILVLILQIILPFLLVGFIFKIEKKVGKN